MRRLLKKPLRLSSDRESQVWNAAMLGLRELARSKVALKHTNIVMRAIYRGLTDEDGRVRYASVQTLD